MPPRYNKCEFIYLSRYARATTFVASSGDLPQGVYYALLLELLERFAQSTPQRRVVGMRLARIYELAVSSDQVKRFVEFGSFVTGKAEPNDVDVFLIMHDAFDLSAVTGEARLLFDHAAAQAHFGASIFWLRGFAALSGEEEAIASWQIKRDGTRRGIVEVKETQS